MHEHRAAPPKVAESARSREEGAGDYRVREDLSRDDSRVHEFMQWDGTIITDSGLPLFSLEGLRTMSETASRSALISDGSKAIFTAESVMQIERNLVVPT